MQQATEQLKDLVRDNNNIACDISVQREKLAVIKFAVEGVAEEIEGLMSNDSSLDGTTASLYLREFEKKVKLIEMGFLYILEDMQTSVDSLESNSSKLFDMVVK